MKKGNLRKLTAKEWEDLPPEKRGYRKQLENHLFADGLTYTPDSHNLDINCSEADFKRSGRRDKDLTFGGERYLPLRFD